MKPRDMNFIPTLKNIPQYIKTLKMNKNIINKTVLEFNCDKFELARLNDKAISLVLTRETDNYSDASCYFYQLDFKNVTASSYGDESENYSKYFYSENDFIIALKEVIIYEFGGLKHGR